MGIGASRRIGPIKIRRRRTKQAIGPETVIVGVQFIEPDPPQADEADHRTRNSNCRGSIH